MTASRKPRTIVSVEPYVKPDGAKRCKVTVAEIDGSETIVPLHDLTRPELQRAAAVTFPEIAANVWLRFKSEEIQTLIRDNDHGAAVAAVAARKSTPGNATPEAVTPVTAPVAAPVAGDAASQLGALIAQHPLEVWSGDVIKVGQYRGAWVAEVQKASEPVDVGRIMYAAAHESFLRQLAFSVEDHESADIRKKLTIGDGYGQPGEILESDLIEQAGTTIILPMLQAQADWGLDASVKWIKEQLEVIFG